MKRILRSIVFSFLLIAALPVQTFAAELLIPVGKVIGLQLQDDTLTVAAFDDAYGACARDAGLQIGDQLLAFDPAHLDDVFDRSIQNRQKFRARLFRCQTVHAKLL